MQSRANGKVKPKMRMKKRKRILYYNSSFIICLLGFFTFCRTNDLSWCSLFYFTLKKTNNLIAVEGELQFKDSERYKNSWAFQNIFCINNYVRLTYAYNLTNFNIERIQKEYSY